MRGFSAMRLSVLGSNERRLAHGAAIIILGGLASGCSSDAMRFTYGSDGMFTGATSNQRQIIAPNQPYPGDSSAGRRRSTARTRARSPARRSSRSTCRHPPSATHTLAPVAGTRLRPPTPSRCSRSRTPTWRRQPAASTDSTGTVKPRSRDARPIRSAGRAPAAPGHRQGRRDRLQSVAPLRRAGRRADEGQRHRRGQRPAGRPEDRHPDLCLQFARRRSRRPTTIRRSPTRSPRSGNKSDVPAGKLPAPADAPSDKVAVLPKSPKLKEGETQPPADGNGRQGRPRSPPPSGRQLHGRSPATRCRRSPGRTASASSR